MSVVLGDPLLISTRWIDCDAPQVRELAAALAPADFGPVDAAQAMFAYVRDRIPHTCDADHAVVTATASQALAAGHGICHAKANLLAALLRARGIRAGIGFQRVTREDDDSHGYCLHAFVLAWLGGRWVVLDATPGVGFCLDEPQFAYPCRPDYDEHVFPGLWADADPGTMDVLETSRSYEAAMRDLPDRPNRLAYDTSCTVSAAIS